MSNRGKRHMQRVRDLACVLCEHLGMQQQHPTEAHHLRDGAGAGQKNDDMLTCALCEEHHRGASGVHGLGARGFRTRYQMEEIDLLAMTLEKLEP